ncbi:MAG: DUF2480 family protein [Bacteroidetes bacterium]|nr:DUF2480 family protein [Bacteroidota bacterium]
MQEEIINRVSQSGLIQISPADFIPQGERVLLDIKPWLFQELILKEKDFREQLKLHDWEQYRHKYVAVHCSADAIIPTWAYMLISSALENIAAGVYFGTLEEMIEILASKNITDTDFEKFRNQRVVIKGCSDYNFSPSIYMLLTSKLKPVVKSIMFGEPCSTVPVFKAK